MSEQAEVAALDNFKADLVQQGIMLEDDDLFFADDDDLCVKRNGRVFTLNHVLHAHTRGMPCWSRHGEDLWDSLWRGYLTGWVACANAFHPRNTRRRRRNARRRGRNARRRGQP